MKQPRLLYLLLLLLACSCTNETEGDLMDSETQNITDEQRPITYLGNIKAIIDSNCLGCHSSPPVNGAPFSLTTYNQVKNIAQSGSLLGTISRQTGESGAMPPAGRIPQTSIDLISQWIDEGLLEE
jgi:uncharacterized membrane protein